VDLVLGGPAVPRAQARKELGLDDVPTALLLGQVRPYKGTGLLAQAWPQVTEALPAARLFVVGQAYDSADLGDLENCPGVEVRPGFVPEGDLDRWAAAADVLVLPYSVGSHSGVLHRGLAAGTPVLASPPLAEEVHRTGAGGIVPLDPRAWARALVSALGSDPLPRPSAPTGRGTARGTLAVYREVLAARAPGVA
jgi:glycosyltransferase involved in cell wall biosynthesis